MGDGRAEGSSATGDGGQAAISLASDVDGTGSGSSLDRIFKRVDRIESSKEPEPVPSASDVSEIAACPPSPITEDPSALPSPTSSLSRSQ